MAKQKGSEGKGATKTIEERETASKAVKDHKKAEARHKDAARQQAGSAWYVGQNSGKSSDKEAFVAGMTQPYAFPGGDQPSVHLELNYRPNQDGSKKELVVTYLQAHEGHPLVGLNKGTFLKAKWLGNTGFKSAASNPSVKKTQDAVIGYLWQFFGGPVTVQNTVVETETKESSEVSAATEQSAVVVTKEFPLENEMVGEKAKTGQISFPVKAGKVIITMSRSAKYGGKDWGYVPTKAYLHMENGSNRCLWDLHQQDRNLGLFYSLIQTADDGYIIIGKKGKGKDELLFTAVPLKSEAEKVEVVKNGKLELVGGMNLLNMIQLKEKVARIMHIDARFTTEEMNMKRRLDAAKSKLNSEKKTEESYRKVVEAGERQKKLMEDIEKNHNIVVYNQRGEELNVLEVDNDTVALMFPAGTHVVMRGKDHSATHKVVRLSRDGTHKKYLAKGDLVTFERPTFEDKATLLGTELVLVNDELGFQEVMIVANRQSAVTLRAQGLNSGAFVAYRDEEDNQMVVLQIFSDRIDELVRRKELRIF